MVAMVGQPSGRKVARKQVTGDDLVNAALCGVFGALGGQLLQLMPQLTIICGMVACAAGIVAFNFLRNVPEKHRSLAALILGGVMIGAVVQASREYTGASYPLQYRVCGRPWMPNGYVEKTLIGIQIANPNKIDLVATPLPDNYSLTSGSYNDPTKPKKADVPTPIHPSGPDPDDDSKLVRQLIFDPAQTPRNYDGHLHIEFKFGTKFRGTNRTLVIDGTWAVEFTEDKRSQRFSFTPDPKKSTFGHIGNCDIDKLILGFPVS
jgi:hypothetical protein